MMRAIAIVAIAAGTAAAQPREQLIATSQRGPHLVIVDAQIHAACDGSAMFLVHAVVANRGTATFGGAPAYGLVGADLGTFGSLIGNGGTVPAIAAGASAEIEFPIYRPVDRPELVTRTMRYELELDRYNRYPAAQMDKHVLVRTASPECSARAQLAH